MEKEKIESYVEKYGKDIYAFCVFLTRNRQEADDLYQDTFLIMIEKNDIRDDMNPKSYLISITIRLWNNRKRKFLWRRKRADMQSSLDEMDPEVFCDVSKPLEEQIITEMERQEIRECVMRLPEKMRVVILMHYMEEMTVEEIGQILKVSAGTVKSRLYYARKKLKEMMDLKEMQVFFQGEGGELDERSV